MYVKYNTVYKVWQCTYSVYKVPVMRVWHQMDSTGHGRDVSAARPQRSVRSPVPRTGAALGPARALRPDDLAAAASAIQRAPPQSVHTPRRARAVSHTHTIDHLLPRLGTTCQPLYTLYCTHPVLYSHCTATRRTPQSVCQQHRAREDVRYVTCSEIFFTRQVKYFCFCFTELLTPDCEWRGCIFAVTIIIMTL